MKWRIKVLVRTSVPERPLHMLVVKPYQSSLPLSGGYWGLFNRCPEEKDGEESWELDWTANVREVYEVRRSHQEEYLPLAEHVPPDRSQGRLLGLRSDRTIRWAWTSKGEVPPYKEHGLSDQQIESRRTVTFTDDFFTHYYQARKNWSVGTALDFPDVSKLMDTPHVLADYLEERCGHACHDWYGFLVALRSTVG